MGEKHCISIVENQFLYKVYMYSSPFGWGGGGGGAWPSGPTYFYTYVCHKPKVSFHTNLELWSQTSHHLFQ